MADGYAVQAELVKLILAAGDTIVGYKVGLTSKPMQRMIGVDSPDYGPVLGSTVYRDGDVVSLSRFIQPKIEAEIVFVLGQALRGPGVTVTDAHRAIAGIAASVEIVDSVRRLADQTGRHRRGSGEQRRSRSVRAARPAGRHRHAVDRDVVDP